MLQIYPFRGNDIQVVYKKLNSFLERISDMDINVPLEQIRAVTKYYPDYETTQTIIEVGIYLGGPAPHEAAKQVRDLHKVILEEKPEATTTQASYTSITSDDFDPFIDSDDLP